MTFDPTSLLTVEELTTPRTLGDLWHWVQGKCRLFVDHPDARERVLLHQGRAKQFHEEVYPLSIFAKHVYGARSDIQQLPNLDTRDFDTRIFDYSTAPPSERKVEMTSAIDGYTEHLRMKYFVEHRQVKAVGEVSVSGTKQTGHKIHVEDEVFAHTDLLQRICSLIRLAVERKSVQPDTPQKYGPGHIWLCSDAPRLSRHAMTVDGGYVAQ